jgi:2-polyprenyl-6-methoxyphenol hydroxylase-like FAD-dependent oxidoreductase
MSERVVIVGCGIAGMCSALALSRKGFDVTVVERDTPPPEGDAEQAFFQWPRRGASQFRHPHAFLGLMCNLLQDNYPDLLEDFYAAGARRLDYRDMLTPELEERYTPRPGDEKLWVLLCRRATIETVLRRYVGRIPNIRIKNGVTIDGLLVDQTAEQDDGSVTVRGLKLRRDCVTEHGETISADVVVDASGRTSRFPRWLGELGMTVPEENDDAEIVYYTRHYRLAPGIQEPPRDSKDRAAGDLGYIKFGVFPGDNGNFAIIVCVHIDETELREAVTDGARFDAICRSIPGLAPWVAEGAAIPTTEPFGIGDIRAVWRHFVQDGKPVARNFFAVGDAALRTNPLYGRGCSTGILHAHMLADVLAEITDPAARAVAFDERTEAQLRPIFDSSLTEDRAGIRRAREARTGKRASTTPESLKKRFGMAFGDAMAAAARYNMHVNRGLSRTINLLEKPGAFLAERRTQFIIFAYMLRGRARNAAARMQRGPSREEMLQMLRSDH